MQTFIKVLKWIVGPVVIIGGLVYFFVFALGKSRTEAFNADYADDTAKIEDNVKAEPIEKTVDFLNKWFFHIFFIVVLSGCGWKTLIIPEPPLVPAIEFSKPNQAGKIELEQYDAKQLKIYLEKHVEYRKRLFELFEKL